MNKKQIELLNADGLEVNTNNIMWEKGTIASFVFDTNTKLFCILIVSTTSSK